MKTYFVAHSNGDFNSKCEGMGDLSAEIEFEMEKGGADYLLITKEELTFEKYGEILDVMRKK